MLQALKIVGIQFLKDVGSFVAFNAINLGFGMSAGLVNTVIGNAWMGKSGSSLLDGWKQGIGEGAYIGLIGGGALNAAMSWNKVLGNLANTPLGGAAFGYLRAKGGFTMGLWEVAMNTWRWSPGQLVESGIYKITDALGFTNASDRKAAEASDNEQWVTKGAVGYLVGKFTDTFLNISALHPFFGFGRKTVNLFSKPFEGIRGILAGLGKGTGLVSFVAAGVGKGMEWARSSIRLT